MYGVHGGLYALCRPSRVHVNYTPEQVAARRMVLPIEAYIDTCSRHNEQPLEAIATALSSEASGGLRIANLKLVPPLPPP